MTPDPKSTWGQTIKGDRKITRGLKLDRRLLIAGGVALAAESLTGCGRIAASPEGQDAFNTANDLSYVTQRALMGTKALAPEFPASEISADFRANGSIDPKEPEYKALVADNFAKWSMPVSGLVEQPRSFTLADLRALPARTQITRHDCVEGWSCIGQWSGPAFSAILDLVKPKPNARFAVFYCYDELGADQTAGDTGDGGNTLDGPPPKFYGTIDMADAVHPQTILAYEMNGAPLNIPHGAPLRLRLERQLGYKMNKYIKNIELVESYSGIGGGKGGYWEDLGYDWYAGI